ncbi:MAG: valyl-tRNA synthetase [Candidatus Atribacteria bacterium]|nr:valyl-tRNA synthetase [Candidatus Atribacteria bacterium]
MDRLLSLPRVFEPEKIEEKWYSFWEEKGYFSPDIDSPHPPFSMVIPPPNVTGYLHMGHALNLTLQDILARWKRMEGKKVLWVPGTDHAGIATQNVVEKQLTQNGLTRHDLGREKFLEKVWQWKEDYHQRIVNQLKKMGASCDWSRERFTMDEGLSRAVKEVFVRLFEEGLIYQDEYIVHWCPRCETALADIEVEYSENSSHLYYVKYPFKENPNEYLLVATTRPETMLGDVALAVHPQDERYQNLIGKVVLLPLVGRELPIIADEYVDPQFGTGVLKVTPAHDPNDFELGKKHQLPLIKVIDSKGKMNQEAGVFAGLSREEAREKIIQELEKNNYLEKIEDYNHSVGRCYRCDTVIEPFVSKQWFVKMKELAEPAMRAVKEGKVSFVPERWSRVYFEWMNNIRDWCVSRQIWWGHRIPVFYCRLNGHVFARTDQPDSCPYCGGPIEQDPDVLDTWFSSALWPFSTLGWPDETEELAIFYPTDVLVTGFDIIFFWVARMIMMGLKFMNEVPFHKVYITPLVRDAEGRKMSKSLGNALDPLEVAKECGIDALRFTLAWLTIQGRDINLSMKRIEASRNFMNKLWNAARFGLMNMEDFEQVDLSRQPLDLKDRWILSRMQSVIARVKEELDQFNFGEVASLLYDFVWGEFCDWYLEWSKQDLYQGSSQEKIKTQNVLKYLLENILKLLHPIIPYITEEIWQNIPLRESESIMVASWPEPRGEWVDSSAEKAVEFVQRIIREIRYLRAELAIGPQETVEVVINLSDNSLSGQFAESIGYIERLAKSVVSEWGVAITRPKGAAISRTKGADIYLKVEGLANLQEEMARLRKKIENLEQEFRRVETRVNNEAFRQRAPREVVEKETRRLEEIAREREKLFDLVEAITIQ